MRWQNGRSRRSRNLCWGNAFKGSDSKKDEGAAHSIQARSSYSNKGRIHSRRPILSSSFFACKTAADHTFPNPDLHRNWVIDECAVTHQERECMEFFA